MPAASPIAPLLRALEALETWLRFEGLDHVYIGGLAVALVGRPRITQDIDGIVLLGEMSIQEFLSRAKASGFSTRVPDALAFTMKSRVFLLRHESTRVPIDLSIGFLPFEEDAVRRARMTKTKGLEKHIRERLDSLPPSDRERALQALDPIVGWLGGAALLGDQPSSSNPPSIARAVRLLCGGERSAAASTTIRPRGSGDASA